MNIPRRKFLGGLAAAAGATLHRPSPSEGQTQEPPYPRPDLQQRALPRRFKYSKPVIDAHTHYYAREFVDLVVKEGAANGAEIIGPDKEGAYRIRARGGGHGAGYYPYEGSTFSKSLSDIEHQLKGMEERDVDMHAIGMTHPKVYWAPPQFALRLSQAQNNGVSAIHVKYPTKFVGQIMLPLQDLHLSLQELERASKLPGMRGINMAQHVNGLNISDKSFWPLWARCAELGHPLVLHNLDHDEQPRQPVRSDRCVDGADSERYTGRNPESRSVSPARRRGAAVVGVAD
jgi:aminocarboxymuconate-semialdehyde decarboxylase